MADTQAEDTPLPYPHAEPVMAPVLVYRRDGLALRTLAGGDIAVEDALVAYTELQSMTGARVRVSTAFLGIDASLGLLERPLLFESVVAGSAPVRHLVVRRYATEADALTGHMQLAQEAAAALAAPPPAPPAPEPTAAPPADPGPPVDPAEQEPQP